MNVKTIHKVEPTKQFSLLCRMGEQLQRELYGKVVRDSLSLCTFPSFSKRLNFLVVNNREEKSLFAFVVDRIRRT